MTDASTQARELWLRSATRYEGDALHHAKVAQVVGALEAVADRRLTEPERALATQAASMALTAHGSTLERLERHLRENGAVVLTGPATWSETTTGRPEGTEFMASSEWGQEAPDSPMAGAAAYGLGASLEEALGTMLAESLR